MTTKATLAILAFCATAGVLHAENEESTNEELLAKKPDKMFSMSAFADLESAYLCRGFVWDTHLLSSQYADGTMDLGPFGRFSAYAWSMLSKSPASHADGQSCRFSEIDYGLRYAYDVLLAEGWTLTSGAAKQWVTFPGRDYGDSHVVMDWQVFQALHNPYLTSYWRMRYIYKPFMEFYWVAGVKRTFPLFIEGLDLTFDFFGDLGDGRHCRNLFGPKPGRPHSSYRDGLQSLNMVTRIDYRIADHVGVFAFVGVYSIVYEVARDAVKAMDNGTRDIAYGGVGVSVDF